MPSFSLRTIRQTALGVSDALAAV